MHSTDSGKHMRHNELVEPAEFGVVRRFRLLFRPSSHAAETPVILRERPRWSRWPRGESAARPKNLPPLARNLVRATPGNSLRGLRFCRPDKDSSVGARLLSGRTAPRGADLRMTVRP